VDRSTLADASPANNLSGTVTDIISMWDAPADWYLDSGVGMPMAIQRGAGELPPRLWELPRPKDPEGSVRWTVEEDRR
jgi:hypothetical protein